MGFFSKRKNENNGFIINTDDEPVKISGNKNLAPHAITADEVSELWLLGNEQSDTPVNTGALDALKKRMNVSETDAPSPKKDDLPKPVIKHEEPTQKVYKETTNNTTAPSQPVDTDIQKTLIEKVKRYTIDEHGHNAAENQEPLYQLESVTEILLHNSENAIKKLSEKYDVFIDDLGKGGKNTKPEPPQKTKSEAAPQNKPSPTATTPTPAFERMVKDSEKNESKQLYKTLFPEEKSAETREIHIPDISDIDTHEVGVNKTAKANTATIRFTPIKDTKGNTDHITVSSVTKQIDLGEGDYEDISSKSAVQTLEQSEFDKFTPSTEVTDLSTGRRLLRKYAIKMRSAFISVLISLLSLIALLVFLIPPIFDFIIGNTKSAMFICGAFLLVSSMANISMFADFKNLIQKRCGFDVLLSLSTVITLALCVTSALTQQNAYYHILLCSIIHLVRAVCRFKELSSFASNLKKMLNQSPKKAVSLINDPATTFAMAKNTIEGDVLVAAHRNTDFINDYVKHSQFSLKLSGKCSIIFYFTLIFSLLSATMAYFYYQGLFEAVYCAASIACIVAMPSLFFINCLPFSSASKKLNSTGAMICGMHGAERIELTNAAVVGINDIFPSGTIKMYSMKVLSNNNIDDTILRAASLTGAVNSPLEAIFKQIAGTNSSYTMPDSDTVKYEKNLGISGWVNNELLFIGNRSLMQAHGIAIPSLEIDKKILRKGYFPVYVATADTACALIVIQYNVKPEIAKELRKVTELGLTLLIENCDPNITEEMICDYFGLYEDSVKIMSNAGVHMFKSATPYAKECSAPAAYRGSNLNLIKIVNRASMIKKSNKLLTILYGIFTIIGIMYFIYAAFSGVTSLPSSLTVLVYELAAAFLSIIGFLIRKP